MNKQLIKVLAIALMMLTSISTTVSAQTDITFSRPSTGESGLSEIEFSFSTQNTEVIFDQLAVVAAALFQNNDNFGQDVGIPNGSPIDSIGEVFIDQVLDPGDNFGSTSLNFQDIGLSGLSPGEDFFLGFSSGQDVGYLNIAWESGPNSSIIYSAGRYASGESLTVVVPNPVPEPSALIWLAALSASVLTQRRRS